MNCPECGREIPSHKLDCGTGRSRVFVPRAVGGYSPEEWAFKIAEIIKLAEDDGFTVWEDRDGGISIAPDEHPYSAVKIAW